MVIKLGIEIDKEIREGWTLRDFIDEIDYSVYQIMNYGGFRKPPTNVDELKIEEEELTDIGASPSRQRSNKRRRSSSIRV